MWERVKGPLRFRRRVYYALIIAVALAPVGTNALEIIAVWFVAIVLFEVCYATYRRPG